MRGEQDEAIEEERPAFPRHEFTALAEDLARLRSLAKTARSPEGDASAKWAANGELVKYLRTNCFTILDALSAGAEYLGRTNGVSKQLLYQALRQLQENLIDNH